MATRNQFSIHVAHLDHGSYHNTTAVEVAGIIPGIEEEPLAIEISLAQRLEKRPNSPSAKSLNTISQ